MMTRTLNRHYTLSDNLNATQGRVFLNGTQALVRLLLSQQRLDKQAGLNTAGFVSGYRGSPLGGVDTALWKASDQLDAAGITFQPAINEDLAATMLMGTQQAGIRSDRNVDGVFAMWYGKGPGLDRAGDAIHHGHAAGASKQGGVLMIVGDDHIAASSSIPHASENALRNWRIPTINPASVEEYEHFGLWGWALSRYSGAWVAFKAVTETIESGRSFEVEPLPHFEASRHDRHKGSLEYDASKFLSPDIELQIENRIRAVREFARQFPLERYLRNDAGAKIGIVSTGKATLDVCDALEELCRESPHPPLKHLKIGLIWPLDENAIRAFAKDLDHILVVEEKGAFIETQIKELLFNDEIRPSIAGKTLNGTELIPSAGQLCPSLMKKALQRWWQKDKATSLFSSCTAQEAEINTEGLSRRPYFCSGCPHNSSTKVPEGSQALGGVGCHYMATSMSRNTQGLTQMGGEGTDWIGLSPYTKTPHIFQNMGEGTYFHSGYLAIRQAVSAKANITYKILFNDAVAMTGGQPVDGPISVPRICQQVMGEGVERVVITTDEPERYRGVLLPDGITVHHRRELDALQRELRDIKGVTVLIHDQSCAAEKRRRRKQKSYSDPAHRLFINTEVCEGCGDCGTQSNCLSLVPEETSLGRKRAIEQSSCNKDYSCVDGFCPSFVSVIGGLPRKRASASVALLREEMLQRFAELGPPQPAAQTASDPCNVLVAGIGGTGVITVGAVLAMAAHLEGRHASIMDMTGLAQKGGSVISHVRLGADARPLGAVRIDTHRASVAILCDMVAASSRAVIRPLMHGHTITVLNEYIAPTAEFIRNPDISLSPSPIQAQLLEHLGANNVHTLDAHKLALRLFGDSIMSNMMMLGMAWQLGGIPVQAEAIEQAITLNGVAVATNTEAFRFGRVLAVHNDLIKKLCADEKPIRLHRAESLESLIAQNAKRLQNYQNTSYATRYTKLVEQLHHKEKQLYPDRKPILSEQAAKSLYKLMAYKDEYEVARLYADSSFRTALHKQFEGDFELKFHLAPPLFSKKDPRTGIPRKQSFGARTEKLFVMLAKAKVLRGTPLDPFSYMPERRTERRLRDDFESLLLQMTRSLTKQNYSTARRIAELPLQIRGFGHVKLAAIANYEQALEELLPQFFETQGLIQKRQVITV